MTDEFEGYGVPRAFACVIREGDGCRELLVFDHPDEEWPLAHVPKGRIDAGESPRDAAARELAEESGLELEPDRFIGHMENTFQHPGAHETVHEDWYLWSFRAPDSVEDMWTHVPEEEAVEYSFRWIPLDGSTIDLIHPYLRGVVERTEQMFGQRRPTR